METAYPTGIAGYYEPLGPRYLVVGLSVNLFFYATFIENNLKLKVL